MRQLKGVALRTIPLSEIEALREAGYSPLAGGDASKANSDYFMVMVRPKEGGGNDVRIVCPSFLRGGLGMSNDGRGFSY